MHHAYILALLGLPTIEFIPRFIRGAIGLQAKILFLVHLVLGSRLFSFCRLLLLFSLLFQVDVAAFVRIQSGQELALLCHGVCLECKGYADSHLYELERAQNTMLGGPSGGGEGEVFRAGRTLSIRQVLSEESARSPSVRGVVAEKTCTQGTKGLRTNHLGKPSPEKRGCRCNKNQVLTRSQ